jgi:hypothetical protein
LLKKPFIVTSFNEKSMEKMTITKSNILHFKILFKGQDEKRFFGLDKN